MFDGKSKAKDGLSGVRSEMKEWSIQKVVGLLGDDLWPLLLNSDRECRIS